MSAPGEEVKLEKREREEDVAAEAVAETASPAAKRVKADGEETAETKEVAPAAETPAEAAPAAETPAEAAPAAEAPAEAAPAAEAPAEAAPAAKAPAAEAPAEAAPAEETPAPEATAMAVETPAAADPMEAKAEGEAAVRETVAADPAPADAPPPKADPAPAADAASAATEVPAAAAAAEPAEAKTVEAETKPAEDKEEKKEVEGKTAAAVEDKGSGEAMSTEEAEAEILKMLEFYFGDSNFGWDRFMQGKVGKMGDGLMDVSILLTFNKLKTLTQKAQLSSTDAEAMVARVAEASPKLRASEDKLQIGRMEPMTTEAAEERMARTVQTRGYKKDSDVKIEDIETLLAEVGKAIYVKICKVSGRKLTSIFVEFETKESAEKAVEKSEEFTWEGESISIRPATRPVERENRVDNKPTKAEPVPVVFEAGKIVHVTGIPSSGVSRESLKEAVKACGTALYIDFSFGELEAWIRMENASEATAVVDAAKEGGLTLAPEMEEKGIVTLLEGEVEQAYYERVEKAKTERNNRSSGGRGRGRGRGRGKGRGGGRGRGRRD